MAIWYILWQFGIFYGNLVYFTAIFTAVWYILWPFGIFYCHLLYFTAIRCNFSVLVSFTKNNLATLMCLTHAFFREGCHSDPNLILKAEISSKTEFSSKSHFSQMTESRNSHQFGPE
jgi:hypothetical protein